jgi:endonuclease/exonuclease/phosphatase family metal-dependent hydrolase
MILERATRRGLLLGLALLVATLGFTGCTTSSPRKAPVRLRVMTFNIHHGEGLDGKVDLARIAALIQQEQADLVALQEVDKGVLRTDQRDLPGELAQLTGMTAVFANNHRVQGGEYGNAILSRFPVLGMTNLHYQMLRPSEQRGLLQAEVNVHGRPLVFMSTHIDYRPNDAERWSNVGEMEATVQGYAGKTVILGGDFNDRPDSRVYERLSQTFTDVWTAAGQGDGFTFPANAPDRRIDYLWIPKTDALHPVKAWVPATDASDHRPLVVELEWR